MWQTEKYIQDFDCESEKMRSHRGPKCGWENNIKTWLSETGREALGWIKVKKNWEKWLTVVNKAMKLPFPYNALDFLISRRTIRFLKRNFHQ
jgi:hypothetical protein